MALQAWIGRTAGQLDADSPLDITLFNGIDDDLIHLKQVLYGDGVGGYLTPVDGHDHDGTNSTIPILEAHAAGNVIYARSLSEDSTVGTTAVLKKRFWIGRAGTITVKGELKSVGAGGGFSSVRVNGNQVVLWSVSGGAGYIQQSSDIAITKGAYIDFYINEENPAETAYLKQVSIGGDATVAGIDHTYGGEIA